MADLVTILAILRSVGTAATAVCDKIDKAFALDDYVRQVLKEPRMGGREPKG